MKTTTIATTKCSTPVVTMSKPTKDNPVATAVTNVPTQLGLPSADTGAIPKITRHSPSETDQRTSWIYQLNKQQLQEELIKFNLPFDGTVEELRKELVKFIRSGQGSTPIRESRRITTAEQVTQWANSAVAVPSSQFTHSGVHEAGYNTTTTFSHPPFDFHSHKLQHTSRAERQVDNIKEMLGLPPDSDFEVVQRIMTSIINQNSSSADMTSNVSQGHRNNVNPPGPPRESRVLETYQDSGSRPENNCQRSTADLCGLVRKWNLKFDGEQNPISFLERLYELIDAYGILPDDVLKALPELLQGPALLWQRNNRELWRNFHDFRSDFELQYLPPDYQRNLNAEIQKRTQGDQESIKQFSVAIGTLMRRRGGYTELDKLERIYANMRPEYKLYVRRKDFNTLQELVRLAEGYESYLREKKNFHPPPHPAQSLVPETAYRQKSNFLESTKPLPRGVFTTRPAIQPSRNERPYGTAVVEDSAHQEERGDGRSSDASKSLRDCSGRIGEDFTRKATQFNNSSSGYGGDRRSQQPVLRQTTFQGAQQPTSRPSHPSLPHRNSTSIRDPGYTAPRRGTEIKRNASEEHPTGARGNQVDSQAFQCWNCSGIGHSARHCPSKKILRCFYCKTLDVRTVDCRCRRSGNESRTSD